MSLRGYRIIIVFFAAWITLCLPKLIQAWGDQFQDTLFKCGTIVGFGLVPIAAVGLWSERAWGFWSLIVATACASITFALGYPQLFSVCLLHYFIVAVVVLRRRFPYLRPADAESATKPRPPKFIVSITLVVAVFVAFLAWYGFPLSLLWPSLALARTGVSHSWIASAFLLIGGVAWLALWSRTQPWLRVVIASVAFPVAYCVLAFYFIARAAVPLPAVTPYDSAPTQRAAYLKSFDEGYRDGTVRFMATYCFRPQAETRGYYDGAYQGTLLGYRMLGRSMPEQVKRWFRSSAAIDGVRLEPK